MKKEYVIPDINVYHICGRDVAMVYTLGIMPKRNNTWNSVKICDNTEKYCKIITKDEAESLGLVPCEKCKIKMEEYNATIRK